METALSAQMTIDAFIVNTARDDDLDRHRSTVTIGARGGLYGYVRIFGPCADPTTQNVPCVIVERYNGSVLFNDERVARVLGATPRPADKHIWEHPLGASGGRPGNFGAVKWGLAPAEIARRYSDAYSFAAEVVNAFKQAGVPW